MIGCGTVKEQPSWVNIGNQNITMEICRDTLSLEGLAHACKTHSLHTSMDEWTLMRYFNATDDILNQYIYTCGPDTIYVVTKYTDEQYIFTMRVNKPVE